MCPAGVACGQWATPGCLCRPASPLFYVSGSSLHCSAYHPAERCLCAPLPPSSGGITIKAPTPSTDPPPVALSSDIQQVIDQGKSEIGAAADKYYAEKSADRPIYYTSEIPPTAPELKERTSGTLDGITKQLQHYLFDARKDLRVQVNCSGLVTLLVSRCCCDDSRSLAQTLVI